MSKNNKSKNDNQKKIYIDIYNILLGILFLTPTFSISGLLTSKHIVESTSIIHPIIMYLPSFIGLLLVSKKRVPDIIVTLLIFIVGLYSFLIYMDTFINAENIGHTIVLSFYYMVSLYLYRSLCYIRYCFKSKTQYTLIFTAYGFLMMLLMINL